MEISFVSTVGLFLIVGGVLLPIYTGNLFSMSKKTKEQYLEHVNKGEKGWLVDFKISIFIRKFWIYITIVGFFLFFIGFYF
ncbi:hypothetical protein SKM54_12215 [Acinetobacter faecalis]|uniref:hypothetical protein n=1 Tax=Acinetobacter faecalis TaxID=2665161 RepID=UPI002A914030|nr:hypothetical protein [Acinetobacter faecalis]MDY6451147.1 hypothetical protein [Acinetobacter faecalis]MDY6483202.1 hypothetical protein [Acinetobacter faecalis]